MKLKLLSIVYCIFLYIQPSDAQFFTFGGIINYQYCGSSLGYIKSGNTFYTKNTIRYRCNRVINNLDTPVSKVVVLPNGIIGGGMYNEIFFLNNTDTSIIRGMNYVPQTPNNNFQINLTEKNCDFCTTGLQHRLDFLRFLNEYSSDSFIYSTPIDPSFSLNSDINSITIYHGTFDIFQDFYSLHFKNVLPAGGVPYIYGQLATQQVTTTLTPPTHFYSRIYRFHAYKSISSPDATNMAVMGGIKNVPISISPGYVDKENDSINVVPLQLYVADTSFVSNGVYTNKAHPLNTFHYSGLATGANLSPANAAIIKDEIRNHAVPIQYQTGYSYQNPFGTNNWLLNNKTGEFTFTPTDTGVYLLAFRVEEYRNSQLLGDFMTYRVALVKDTLAKIPDVSTPFSITGAGFNSSTQTFTICAGQPMSYKVKVTSSTSGSQIIAASNALQSAPTATVSFTGQSTDSAGYNFSWTPTKDDIGWHYIYVDGVDTACGPSHYPIHQSKGVIIQVQGAKIQSDNKILCKGDTATLQNWSSGSYQWSVLPGGDPYLPCTNCASIKVSPSVTTSYVLQSMTGGMCNNMKDTFTVTVVQPFTLTSHDTSFSGGIPSNFQLPLTVTPAGYYVYQWLPYNIVTDAHIPNPKPVGWGNHNTYIVVVKDSFNCFTVTDTIHVNANTAGVTVLDNNEAFKIYPNPTNGVLHINSIQSGILIIQDLAGKEVAQYSIKEGMQDINLSGKLSSGHYLGHFIGKDQTQLVIKLEYEK